MEQTTQAESDLLLILLGLIVFLFIGVFVFCSGYWYAKSQETISNTLIKPIPTVQNERR